MAAIMKGREGREKFGSGRQKLNEFASTTNKQKAKKKNFSMMKHKIKKKVKRSFRHTIIFNLVCLLVITSALSKQNNRLLSQTDI